MVNQGAPELSLAMGPARETQSHPRTVGQDVNGHVGEALVLHLHRCRRVGVGNNLRGAAAMTAGAEQEREQQRSNQGAHRTPDPEEVEF